MEDEERGSPDGGMRTTRYALLGLLTFREEASGYELKQLADRTLRFFWFSPAMSQVYAELERLADAGLVSARRVAGPGRGRSTRLFRITTEGRARLARWLEEAEVEFPVLKHSVALRLFFSGAAGPGRPVAVLQQYLERLQGRIAELEGVRDAVRDDPDRTYPALVAEWGLRYYANEVTVARDLLSRLDEEAGPARA